MHWPRTAEAKRHDESWIQRLTPAEVDGFHGGLAARQVDRQAFARDDRRPTSRCHAASAPRHPIAPSAPRRAAGACVWSRVSRSTTGPRTRSGLAYWGMGLYMGVSAHPEPRQPGHERRARRGRGTTRSKGGRGYNTNAGLDFHKRLVPTWSALLCRRTAKSGGDSKVVSSIALRDEVTRRRPDLLPGAASSACVPRATRAPRTRRSRRSTCARSSASDPRVLRGAHQPQEHRWPPSATFPEVPRLTPAQTEALDLIDQLMPRPVAVLLDGTRARRPAAAQQLRRRCTRAPPFEDYEEPSEKRHLLRLWLAMPYVAAPAGRSGRPTSATCAPVRVRGGVVGSAITPEFLAYEARQAAALGMPYQSRGSRPADVQHAAP